MQVAAITNSDLVLGIGGWANVGGAGTAITWQDGIFTNLDPEYVWSYQSMALAANGRGQVVGFGRPNMNTTRPLLWDHGEMIDLLGSVEGDGSAVGINERGQVVVTCFDYNEYSLRAYLWDRGKLIDLGLTSAYPGRVDRTGLKLNARGDVIGDDQQGESFFWRNGIRTELPFLAEDLNDNGQVVGGGFLWNQGTLTTIESPDGQSVKALSINNRGDVAGLCAGRAFRWVRGRMELLQPIGFWLITTVDMGEQGQIVGLQAEDHWFTGDGGGRILLWEPDHLVAIDLTASVRGGPIVIPDCISINAAGRIVFSRRLGDYPSFIYQSYLWKNGEAMPLVPLADPTLDLSQTHAVVAIPRPDLDAPETLPTGDTGFGAINVERQAVSGPARVRFMLLSPAAVNASVFDVQGRRVRSLVEGEREAGEHQILWDGLDESGQPTPAGIYFVRLEAGPHQAVKRLIRLR